ncbi:hypothetical protein O181_093997 [Austropuccinia psidii MF-1]|uniref:Uncharacterized protein n=1 Tax=Austropuccinia psidii MF-1 TaxID=1389203 RepID=A0A9Q3J2J6_9BASI|nr:hypothetical protein [Austropuccinia psidii MF-1]
MEEVNEADKKENKVTYEPVDTDSMLYPVLVDSSEIIEGPPINSRKTWFEIFSKQKSQENMESVIKSELNNNQYSEDSLEDIRNKSVARFKNEEFIKEYNREYSNQTV